MAKCKCCCFKHQWLMSRWLCSSFMYNLSFHIPSSRIWHGGLPFVHKMISSTKLRKDFFDLKGERKVSFILCNTHFIWDDCGLFDAIMCLQSHAKRWFCFTEAQTVWQNFCVSGINFLLFLYSAAKSCCEGWTFEVCAAASDNSCNKKKNLNQKQTTRPG